MHVWELAKGIGGPICTKRCTKASCTIRGYKIDDFSYYWGLWNIVTYVTKGHGIKAGPFGLVNKYS